MRQCDYSVELPVSVTEAFEYLDDPRRLSSHMEKSSWMMAGSKMDMELDSKQGKSVGAEIVLKGGFMGIPLLVREVVSERQPPHRKVWKTVGDQKMIVIDQYSMGFELTPERSKARLKVFIEYVLPKGIRKFPGVLFANLYARWCTKRMAQDAVAHFKSAGG